MPLCIGFSSGCIRRRQEGLDTLWHNSFAEILQIAIAYIMQEEKMLTEGGISSIVVYHAKIFAY